MGQYSKEVEEGQRRAGGGVQQGWRGAKDSRMDAAGMEEASKLGRGFGMDAGSKE